MNVVRPRIFMSTISVWSSTERAMEHFFTLSLIKLTTHKKTPRVGSPVKNFTELFDFFTFLKPNITFLRCLFSSCSLSISFFLALNSSSSWLLVWVKPLITWSDVSSFSHSFCSPVNASVNSAELASPASWSPSAFSFTLHLPWNFSRFFSACRIWSFV